MFGQLFSQGGLSIDRLKNFVLVAEKGSIARVAEGDPARQALISRQIKELEGFFGTELTRRKGRGLALTDAGTELARQVRIHFTGLADFKAKCRDQPVEFRIAAANSLIEWVLAPAMGELAEAVPGSTFALLDCRTADSVRGLLDHVVDFAVIRRSAVVKPLRYLALGHFGYSLFVPAAFGPDSSLDPRSMPMALTGGSDFLRQFEQAAADSTVAPRVVFRCSSFTQAAQLVRAGAAAAVLPDVAAAALAGDAVPARAAWLAGMHRDYGLAWHRQLMEIRPLAGKVRDAIRAQLATGASTTRSSGTHREG